MNVIDDKDDWTSFTAAPSNHSLYQEQTAIVKTGTVRILPQSKSKLGVVKRVQSPSSLRSSSVKENSTGIGKRHTLPVPNVDLNEEEEDAWDM